VHLKEFERRGFKIEDEMGDGSNLYQFAGWQNGET